MSEYWGMNIFRLKNGEISRIPSSTRYAYELNKCLVISLTKCKYQEVNTSKFLRMGEV